MFRRGIVVDTNPIKAYVAGHDGFTEAGRDYLYGKVIPMLKELGIGIINPWELTPQAAFDEIAAMPLGPERTAKRKELNFRTGQANHEGILEATIVIANLNGQEVDSGTASEIGAGAMLGKAVFGYRDDFRQTGEDEAIVNLQVEYWIRNSGGDIAQSLGELKEMLTERWIPLR